MLFFRLRSPGPRKVPELLPVMLLYGRCSAAYGDEGLAQLHGWITYNANLELEICTKMGVHRGNTLLPILFILCMDTVTADLQMPHPWTMLYANNVMLTCEGVDIESSDWSINERHGSMNLDCNLI
ncbi:hypothetical protein L345_01795, partial [Ophiophagus hannah]